MNGTGPNLLIIGASARAAAFSALRAGLKPLCLDMFADSDLQANAIARSVENYPEGLIDALKAIPRLPILYTGGLENQPDVLKAANEFHDLMGNTAENVALARNAEGLVDSWRIAQVEAPEWRVADHPPPTDGTWILRPLFGSGGRGITTWDENATSSPVLLEPHGFQKRIEGTSYSGVYLASKDVGDVRFVGVTQQLIGLKECNAAEYQWCGNIGPTTLSVEVEHKMRRVGNVLKWKAEMKGVFGVDFIVTDDERIFAIEVNPRYPASLELLEFSTGLALIEGHVRCFAETDAHASWSPNIEAPLLGKAILYSPEEFSSTADLSAEIKDYTEFPTVADIPNTGTEFEKGDPICTVYAHGQTIQDCREALITQLSQVSERILPSAST